MSEVNQIGVCPLCHLPVVPSWYFCPNCGKPLQEKPPEISLFKQIYIYSISFFLTPLGLIWGIKYVRSKERKVRIVGLISIFLTVLSFVLMSLALKGFLDQVTKMFNSLNGTNVLNNLQGF